MFPCRWTHVTTEAGEGLEVMPGSTATLALEIEPLSAPSLLEDNDLYEDLDDPEWEWRPQLLISLLNVSLRL